jgi:hypothetical protein
VNEQGNRWVDVRRHLAALAGISQILPENRAARFSAIVLCLRTLHSSGRLHRAIRKGNGFEPFWEFQVAEMNKSAPLTLRDGLRRMEGFVRALYGTIERGCGKTHFVFGER